MILTKKLNSLPLNKKAVLCAAGSGMLGSVPFITPAMWIGSAAYFCFLAGVLYRKNRLVHISFMHLGILLDLSLVAVLEIQRNAIDTALSMKLNGFQQLHILVSILAVVLYFFLLVSGWLKVGGKIKSSHFTATHRFLGPWAFLFRSLSYALMFSMLMPKP